MQKFLYKKICSLAAILLLSTFLASCGGGGSSTTDDGDDNNTGATDNYGSLSLSGSDSAAVNGIFNSESVEVFESSTVAGALSVMWRASDQGFTVSYSLNPDDSVQAVAVGFAVDTGNIVDIYHYHGYCSLGEPLADCSTITVDRASKLIQFDDFSIPVFAPGEAGNVASGPLILNGTLLWE